ncbi:fibronectin type III domain-containing protein [Candidatus Uhrbacteria bacterium]|nr:fibronectin type III domain-containing protein [Candidatus Uhrbacteria bacterium]
MKSYFKVAVVLIILGVLGFVLWNREREEAIPKVHPALFENASGTWDAQMQVLPFRPKEVNGVTVGFPTQLRLEWSKPEQPYNHFVITVTEPLSGYTRTESGEHDRVSLDPDGLTPETEYVFAIQACLDPRCEKWLIGTEESRGTTGPAEEPQPQPEENTELITQ